MKLYRVGGCVSVDMSDDDSWSTRRIRHHSLDVREFDVIRETPKGKWIDDYSGERWVSNTSRKRYAYPTIEEAYKGFIGRRKNQKRILEAQLDDCLSFIGLAEEVLRSGKFSTPSPTRLT